MSGDRKPLEGIFRHRSQAHCTAQVEPRSTGGIQGSILQSEEGHPEDEEAAEEGDSEVSGVARKQAVERTHRPP